MNRLTPKSLLEVLENAPIAENRRFYMLCSECNTCWIQRESPRPRCKCQTIKKIKCSEFTCEFHFPNTAYFYEFDQNGKALFSCLDEKCVPYLSKDGYS